MAGLLLARAAAGQTDVRRALLTRWGLDDLDPTARAACAARTRHAYTRLRRLAVSTGVPEVLRAALVLAETTAQPDLPAALRRDGLSDGRGGLLLVEGLRRAYGGLRPSAVAWQALTEQELTRWDRLLQGLFRRGVRAVLPRLLHHTDDLAGYLRSRNAVLHGAWLVPVADYSSLGRLLQRQLALTRALPIAELQAGVRRATGTAPPVAALQAWLLQHRGAEVRDGQTRTCAAPVPGWSTREDRLLLSCFGDRRHATRRELVATGLAAGRTQGAMSVALARSPILRRDQRGVYRLPSAARQRP